MHTEKAPPLPYSEYIRFYTNGCVFEMPMNKHLPRSEAITQKARHPNPSFTNVATLICLQKTDSKMLQILAGVSSTGGNVCSQAREIGWYFRYFESYRWNKMLAGDIRKNVKYCIDSFSFPGGKKNSFSDSKIGVSGQHTEFFRHLYH